MLDLAAAEARANFNKDITFRRWGTSHGGVYVPITDTQKPVPWMAHMPNRDVTTTDGTRLTLLNPASMLRQMMQRYTVEYVVRGKITGLKQLNPGNAPDDWERAMLVEFQQGKRKNATAVVEIAGEPYYRYFEAMFMEPGCIKCHAVLDYTRVGELRGRIGIAVPMKPYLAAYRSTAFNMGVSHAVIWLLGLAGIVAVRHTYSKAEAARARAKPRRDARTPRRRTAPRANSSPTCRTSCAHPCTPCSRTRNWAARAFTTGN